MITLAEVGGAQAYVTALLPCLAKHFDVCVAAHGSGVVRAAAGTAGVRFHALRHVRRPVSPWRDLLGLAELVVLMRRERPHVVHAHSSKAGVLARVAAALTGVPSRIFTVHGWAFTAHRGAAALLYRWVERLVAPLTTLWICVSESERRTGLRARACTSARTIVIPPALDVAGRPGASPEAGPARVITVGRLRPPKDPLTLVRALARVRPTPQAVVVGDGPGRADLEHEIERLGLTGSVVLAGERDDVPELLADAHVFVLSSASEALPVSILEAMAAGLPVVATAVGGMPELVVDGETGLLVRPRDVGGLAGAIERLAGNPGLRRRLGDAGRARVEARFDLPAFREAHLAAYRTVLAASSPKRSLR